MRKLILVSLITTSLLFVGCGPDKDGNGQSYFDRFGNLGTDSDNTDGNSKDTSGGSKNSQSNTGNSKSADNSNNSSGQPGATGQINSDLTSSQFADVLTSSDWCGNIGGTSIGVIFNSDGTGEIFDVNNANNPDNQPFNWEVKNSPANAKATYSVYLDYADGFKETLPTAAMNGYIIMFIGNSRQMVYTQCDL